MSQIVSTLTGLQGAAVYVAVGLLVFAEAAVFVGLVVPGETALLVGGVLAERGHVSLAWLLVLGCVAAVAGDSVGYAVGRRFGPVVQRSRVGRRVGEARWGRAHSFVSRHGSWAVVLGRWVGVLRALVPAVVGMVRMPYRRFLVANAVGGVTWVVTILMIGYAAGGSIAIAGSIAGRMASVGLAVVVLIAVAVALAAHRRRARTDGAWH